MVSRKKFTEGTKANFLAKITFVLFFISTLFQACQQGKTPLVDKQVEAEERYTMYTQNVNLLVSDSGITQYHLEAKAWYIYDKGVDSYWFFPHGFYAEKIDTCTRPIATLVADTAYYYSNQGRWLFLGKVKVKNLSGDTFLAKSLSWDSASRKVSSEDSVTVISTDHTLSGTSFIATQDFSRYVFLNNQGQANIPEEELDPKRDDEASKDSMEINLNDSLQLPL